MTGAPPGPPARRPTVLVAEDDASVRLLLSVTLRQYGIDAVLAEHGEEAIARLEEGVEADVLLVDIRMPVLGGVALVRRLRADPRWRSLPVVAMSAYNDEQQQREVMAAGADRFLPKPFAIADLIETLGQLIALPHASR